MKNDLEETNRLLRGLLKLIVEVLPRHTEGCGVHKAHPSYGDKYCDCNLEKLRNEARKTLGEV